MFPNQCSNEYDTNLMVLNIRIEIKNRGLILYSIMEKHGVNLSEFTEIVSMSIARVITYLEGKGEDIVLETKTITMFREDPKVFHYS